MLRCRENDGAVSGAQKLSHGSDLCIVEQHRRMADARDFNQARPGSAPRHLPSRPGGQQVGTRAAQEQRRASDGVVKRPAFDILACASRVDLLEGLGDARIIGEFKLAIGRLPRHVYREVINQKIETVLQDVGLWEEVKDRLNSPALALSGGQQHQVEHQKQRGGNQLQGDASDLLGGLLGNIFGK